MIKLKKFICKKKLLFPEYSNMNIVDLVKYLYSIYGVKCDENGNIKKLKNIIPVKKHMVFILIDGMGSNLISMLNDDSQFKKNKIMDIITVCPSSTGCVLTSVATAAYPCEHGIIGWYNYNRKYNIDYCPLTYCDRKQNKDLEDLNIKKKDIFLLDSKLNNLNVKTTVLYPKNICNSTYSKYVANDNIRKSYNSIENAINQIQKIISSDKNTFTYLYIPDIDSLEHDNGFDSDIVVKYLNYIENQIQKINNKDCEIIITADHGQVNVYNDITMNFKKYSKYFYAYPGIDFGMSTYYVKKEMEKSFIEEFNKDYKNRMYLFKTEEFLKNNLFGNNKNYQNIKNSLGEYISLCNSDSQFINSEKIDKYYGKTKGNHSGLSKDEMIIPLIVIKND